MIQNDPGLDPPPDPDWGIVAVAVVLALLALAMCACCQTCPAYDRPVMVDASAVWRCDDHWCVSDGWMATHDADDDACNSALGACLTALESCPE